MKLLPVAVAMAACGAAQRPKVRLDQPVLDKAAALAQASQTGDVAAIRAMLGPQVTNGGLWFADPTCTNEFATPGEIGGGRLDELARCLAGLRLATTTRHEMLADVAVMTYGPGIEVEARILDTDNGPWLSWIGYESKLDASDGLPTISPATLESLRDAGEPHPAGNGLGPKESAWFKVCLDSTGAVTNAHVRSASSLQAARTFGAAIATWHFRPFAPVGQPLPVCSLVALTTPDLTDPVTLPPPIATPNGEPILYPHVRATYKDHSLLMTADVNRTMRAENLRLIITAVMYCVSERGDVYAARVIRRSGFPTYDSDVLHSFEADKYEPYRDGDKPVAFCTAGVNVYERR